MSNYSNIVKENSLCHSAELIADACDSAAKAHMGNVSGLVRTWYSRHIQRKQLRELSPRLLKDIGITQHEALIEASKPFWIE